MTIGAELEAEILRLYHAEKWRVGTTSAQLGIHHNTIKRVIAEEGSSPAPVRRRRMVDPFLPFIEEMLRKYPQLTAKRLHCMVRERGYPGQGAQFRAVVSQLRGSFQPEPYLRLKTLPGEQAQVDWGHFGQLEVGRAVRPLMAFVMVLSYARAVFLKFFFSQALGNFLRGHQDAFAWFQGVPRVCLYDNLKSVVLERIGQAIRFNPQFMEFAGHCRFEPRPVAVARGNEKGRVERSVRYIRSSFFAARHFKDIEDLNRQALQWCEGEALTRRWPEDHSRTVGEVFREEQPKLLPLPADEYPCEERCQVTVGKSPYVRFDLNDYSVPHTLVQKSLALRASPETVRILDGDQVIATHARCYDRGRQIEEPGHIEELSAAKAAAGQHRRTNLLSDAAPSSAKLLTRMGQRGLPLAGATKQLVALLRTYGAESLEAAIREALLHDSPHPHAVRLVLERCRHESGKPPALPLSLPDDPRVSNLIMKPHDLTDYDHIQEEDNHD
jgi:transposase